MPSINIPGRRYPPTDEPTASAKRLFSLGTIPVVPPGSSVTLNGQVRGRRFGPMQMAGMGGAYLPSKGTVGAASFNAWWAAASNQVMDAGIPV